MRARLNMLEDMTTSYKRYKGFVDSIEKAIADSPSIKFTETARSNNKAITTQEAVIKIKLKADLLREFVPMSFKPSIEKIVPELSKEFNAQKSLELLSEKQQDIAAPLVVDVERRATVPQTTPSREQKDWFIPANDVMRSFQQSIDNELKARGHHVQMPESKPGLQGVFIAGTKPEKKAVYETVRQKVREEAQEKREEVPPQYKQEPHQSDAPKESKMSGAFNRVSAESKKPAGPEIAADSYDL